MEERKERERDGKKKKESPSSPPQNSKCATRERFSSGNAATFFFCMNRTCTDYMHTFLSHSPTSIHCSMSPDAIPEGVFKRERDYIAELEDM